MFIQLNKPADHGFDEPLGLLSDCHRRIERFLGIMLTIARAARGAPLEPEQKDALQQALTYFRTAAPRHTADEEASLFPRLREAGSAGAAVVATLERLDADHRTAERHHAAADRLCTRWMEEGRLEPACADDLVGHLESLEGIYSAHIAVEDRELFPAAARMLRAADLEAVGREMADRRGVPFKPR